MRHVSKLSLGFISFFLLPLLAACGAGEGAGSGSAEGSSGHRFLSLGTAPPGGAFFVVGSALADVAAAASDGAWEITAESTKGSRENIRRLAQGELDFALSNAAISYFAVRGESGWDQQYEIRSVMTLAPNVAFFVTRADSGVASHGDLAGRRVVVGPAGAGFELFVGPLLQAHGVSLEDFTLLNAPQAGAVDLLADRSADAAFLGGAVPTASITQAATSMELSFVPFDPAARQQLVDDFPFFAPATVPAGTYRGQEEDYLGLNVGSMQLITHADASDDLVYAFTKAIYENRAQVVERHPAGRAIQAQVVVRDTGTPFHPGAERFYREIGIWPDLDTAAEASSEPADDPAATSP